MFGGDALSIVTPKTWPTCAAVTVNGFGAAITCACGGAPGDCRLKTRAEGPFGSINVKSPGSWPGAICAGGGAPENPVMIALPGANIPEVCAAAPSRPAKRYKLKRNRAQDGSKQVHERECCVRLRCV